MKALRVFSAVLLAAKQNSSPVTADTSYRRMFASSSSSPNSMFRERYFRRLGFSKEDQTTKLLAKPSLVNLNQLIEAHLAKITFDNLAQHGLPNKACLQMDKTAEKVLEDNRGGFCFEINGLFAELLSDLGYGVKRIPAFVNISGGFRTIATHMILVVSCSTEEQEEEYLVDVGFGEPPIHALHYKQDIEQETPEGMISRLVRCRQEEQEQEQEQDDDLEDWAFLEWKKGEEWVPRLKWIWNHPGQELSSFQEGLDFVLNDDDATNPFHQKLIVCKLDRNQKLSLAGTRLKITTPRLDRIVLQQLQIWSPSRMFKRL